MVAVVTVNSLGDDGGAGDVSINEVLQGNANGNVYPPTAQELPRLLALAKARVGRSYVIFTSFNRGGACPSALFGYDRATQVATLISQWTGLGPSNQIPLPGGATTIPATMDLSKLRERMYPTGGVTYRVGTDESFCPGP
jgi:hypothetical protein